MSVLLTRRTLAGALAAVRYSICNSLTRTSSLLSWRCDLAAAAGFQRSRLASLPSRISLQQEPDTFVEQDAPGRGNAEFQTLRNSTGALDEVISRFRWAHIAGYGLEQQHPAIEVTGIDRQ